jgi:ribosomal protein L12E/L44/L45/RPP1/RPP2
MQQQEAGGADLQQVRAKEEEEEEEEEEGLAMVFAVWDCGSPLYDSFELASLHHVLESHLMVLPFSGAATSWSRRLEHRGGEEAAEGWEEEGVEGEQDRGYNIQSCDVLEEPVE